MRELQSKISCSFLWNTVYTGGHIGPQPTFSNNSRISCLHFLRSNDFYRWLFVIDMELSVACAWWNILPNLVFMTFSYWVPSQDHYCFKSNHKIYISRSNADSVKLNLPCFAEKNRWACCLISVIECYQMEMLTVTFVYHGHTAVSAAMRDVLHWLSFPQRVTFKLCLLTYKCLHGLEPEYLLRCCVRLAAVTGQSQPPFRRLTTHLLLPRTSTVMQGSWAFYSSGSASCTSTPWLETRRLQAAAEDCSIYADVGGPGPVHHARLCDVFALTVRVEMTVYLPTYFT